MKVFDHVGIPTDKVQKDERYVERTSVYVTDPKKHPFCVEWLRYLPESIAPEKLRTSQHIAFHVDSIEAEAEGLTVLLEPFGSVAGHRVGFYETPEGVIVELMEY